jgi:diacylglycerol kinase family enzyme
LTSLRVLLTHNPSAGDEEHSPRVMVRLLERAGHEVRWQSTKDRDWQQALDKPADLVAVAGGDGTVRKVFRELVGRALRATLLPVGSANNIARSLGFEDDDPARLIAGWPKGHVRSCDIASLRAVRDEQRFLESAGGGLFAELLISAEEDDGDEPSGDEKIERGRRLLLATLAEVHAQAWEVELDGDSHAEELIALEVMNVREAGPNVPLAPEADPGDGLLEVVLLREADAGDLAGYVEALLDDRAPTPPRFDVRRARRIALRPPQGSALHLDDEILGEQTKRDAGELIVVQASASIEVLVPAPLHEQVRTE